jgi:hypothetical protein
MTTKDILKGLKSGEIRLNSSKHLTNDVVRDLEWAIQDNDELKDKAREENDQKMLEAWVLREQVKIGRPVTDLHDIYCWHCGTKLSLLVLDEKNVALLNNDVRHADFKEGRYNQLYDENHIKPCEFFEVSQRGYLEANIEVPTGDMIFANFFREKKFYDQKPNRDRYIKESINAVRGRDALMQDLASENVGYGQMGNMSVAIFLKKDKKEIIVSTDYGYNDKDGEYEVKHPGFTLLGKISLEVWRWQCADKKVLLDGGEELPIELDYSTKKSDSYEDHIMMKVAPGKWNIKHYYDFFTDEKEESTTAPIYSHLKLVE